MRAMVLARRYAIPFERGKLRALAGLGADVTAVVPDAGGAGDRARYESDGGLRIIPVPARGQLEDPGSLRWSGRAIRRTIREVKPDLIQVEEEPWTALADRVGREAKRAGIPLVGFSREPWPEHLPMGDHARRRRLTSRARAMIAESTTAAQALGAEVAGSQPIVIPQAGVEVPGQPVQHDRDPVTLAFVGRLVPARGLDALLRAAATISLPWRLLVSGTGPSQVEYEQLAERLGVAARIEWRGAQPRDDRLALLAESDVLVAPHRADGAFRELVAQPTMQAMARGLAVIASPEGLLPDLVGDAGIIVPPDQGEAFAAALGELILDPEARRGIGAACRRRAQESFSHAALAARTMSLWTAVTAAV